MQSQHGWHGFNNKTKFMEQMVARQSALEKQMTKLSVAVTKASTGENSRETSNNNKEGNKGLRDNNHRVSLLISSNQKN